MSDEARGDSPWVRSHDERGRAFWYNVDTYETSRKRPAGAPGSKEQRSEALERRSLDELRGQVGESLGVSAARVPRLSLDDSRRAAEQGIITELPRDEAAEKARKAREDKAWVRAWDERRGRHYWLNKVSLEARWKKPRVLSRRLRRMVERSGGTVYELPEQWTPGRNEHGEVVWRHRATGAERDDTPYTPGRAARALRRHATRVEEDVEEAGRWVRDYDEKEKRWVCARVRRLRRRGAPPHVRTHSPQALLVAHAHLPDASVAAGNTRAPAPQVGGEGRAGAGAARPACARAWRSPRARAQGMITSLPDDPTPEARHKAEAEAERDPDEWVRLHDDATGRAYWFNRRTYATSFSKPHTRRVRGGRARASCVRVWRAESSPCRCPACSSRATCRVSASSTRCRRTRRRRAASRAGGRRRGTPRQVRVLRGERAHTHTHSHTHTQAAPTGSTRPRGRPRTTTRRRRGGRCSRSRRSGAPPAAGSCSTCRRRSCGRRASACRRATPLRSAWTQRWSPW